MKKVLYFVIIMVFTVVMVGCMDKQDEERSFYSTEDKVFAIETPYCDLQYPIKWKNKVEICNVEHDDIYKVCFSTSIDGQQIKLFDIIFGGDDGYLLGILNNVNKVVEIYVIEYQIDGEEYSNEHQIELGGMKNDINVIISKLVEQYDFKLD